MKLGSRTPNLSKSVKARTTGRVKRAVKSSYNPTYGKKGIGYLKNPKKSYKNSIYHKTTYDVTKPIKESVNSKKSNLIKTKKQEINELDNRLNEVKQSVNEDMSEEELLQVREELKKIRDRMSEIENDEIDFCDEPDTEIQQDNPNEKRNRKRTITIVIIVIVIIFLANVGK